MLLPLHLEVKTWKMHSCQMKKRLQMLLLLIGAVMGLLSSVVAKPTIKFNFGGQGLLGFPSFQTFTQQIIEARSARQMKTYSGKRLTNDSLIMIYFNDATIAVTELGPQKLLLGCELIEIYEPKEGEMLLENLAQYNRPLEITFEEMIKLMGQCERVDKLAAVARSKAKSVTNGRASTTATTTTTTALATADNAAFANMFPKSPFALFNGIIPGTKWCGPGDIAGTYNDLGTEEQMDRCCRQHDLCPIKVRAYQTKYDLTNDALYTKSHCICDDMLFDCLKRTNTSSSQFMGSIYFNLVQVPCVDGTGNSFRFRAAKEGF